MKNLETFVDKLIETLQSLVNKRPQEKLVPVYVRNKRQLPRR